MEKLEIRTESHNQLFNLTESVQALVRSSGVQSGLCTVYCPHTTAAVTINEGYDPAVAKDMLDHLSKLIPADPQFEHSEGNSDAHIKASLVGESVSVLIDSSSLVLGTWQKIFFCEFDGPRTRKVFVSILGG